MKDEEKPVANKDLKNRLQEILSMTESELKKVIWPTPKTLSKNVLISLGVMLASAIVLWGFDELATMLVNALFTLAG